MDFLLAFALFSAALAVCLWNDVSIVAPLLLGLAVFAGAALREGHSLGAVTQMCVRGMKKSLPVLAIFALIGLLTAVWRTSGTIPFFVYYGIEVMPPRYFILFAFLLSSLVSYALGTCFGTVATLGVVLMVLARSGGVDTDIAVGAILSGAFFGDRCAPTSSAANLVAALTETHLYDNVRIMFKTGFVPTILAALIYLYLSLNHPLERADTTLLSEIAAAFNLDVVVALPALLVFALPLCGVKVKTAMLLSILAGAAASLWCQEISFPELLRVMVAGYYPDASDRFGHIIAGGGLFSMIKLCVIVLISSTYSGIFDGTRLLDGIQDFLERLSRRFSLYPTTLFVSSVTNLFTCNQTLAVILTYQLMSKLYDGRGVARKILASDLENTALLICGLVPWSLAVAMPLTLLAADAGSIPYAVFLWLTPIVNLFSRRTEA